jgi:hypothetical protein
VQVPIGNIQKLGSIDMDEMKANGGIPFSMQISPGVKIDLGIREIRTDEPSVLP